MGAPHPESGVFPDEETSPGLPLSSMPPLPDDVHEALGVLMGAVARHGRHMDNIKRELGMLRTEVVGLRKDLNLDRKELVQGASVESAKRASNRMAALMGALFTIYELTAPYLHEIARWFHR